MRLKTLLKIGLSAALLAVALRVVNVGSLAETLVAIPTRTVVLVVAGYLAGQLLSAFKWWCIVRRAEPGVGFGRTLHAYYTGMFVNVLGIGTLGGDMTRAVLVCGPGPVAKATGVASVVADRAHGLAVLAGIGAAAAAVTGGGPLPGVYTAVLVGFGAAVVLGWAVGPRLLARTFRGGHHLREAAERVARAFPHDPRTLLLVTAVSVLFHLTQISLHKVMADGLGASAGWSYLFMAVPFTNIVASLPVSWQGLGVRENAYRFFFVPHVLTPEQAVAFGALWLLAVTVSGLVGGVVSVFGRPAAEATGHEAPAGTGVPVAGPHESGAGPDGPAPDSCGLPRRAAGHDPAV